MRVRRALLSVSDKTGIVDFARGLADLGIEILTTGGTAALLRSAGVDVIDVSSVTGYPEILDGRVKTLHPLIHGGILGRRDDATHVAQMAEHGIDPVDLLCVNLYPFEQTVANADTTLEEAIEQIDIGGPAMIRAGSKNFQHVVVVTQPRRYTDVLDVLREGDGSVPVDLRRELARAAFRLTARYDAAIGNYLAAEGSVLFPQVLSPLFEKGRELRYGENPFQRAAVYTERGSGGPCVAKGELLWGKEPSFNNLLDLDAAMRIVREFERPAAVVVKHTNPCGCAIADTSALAYARAHSGDPLSAYGCVLGFNRVVDAETARAVAVPEHFVECIVAPGFDAEALQTLTSRTKWGKSLRLLKVEDLFSATGPRDRDVRRILGGILLQQYDDRTFLDTGWKCVSERPPTEAEVSDLEFAWKVCKHVRSNAIVIARDGAVVGVGAGQMSRVDSARIAVRKAGDRARGAALASDAFFPFADGLEVALKAGVSAAIEPGGSRNDHEVIAAANDAGATLVFTGMRHFRH